MEILPIWLRDRIRVMDASERSAINIRKAAMCNNTNIIETLLSSNHSAFKQRICTSLSKLSGPGYQPLFWDRGFGCRHLRGLLQSPQRQQWCGDGQFWTNRRVSDLLRQHLYASTLHLVQQQQQHRPARNMVRDSNKYTRWSNLIILQSLITSKQPYKKSLPTINSNALYRN